MIFKGRRCLIQPEIIKCFVLLFYQFWWRIITQCFIYIIILFVLLLFSLSIQLSRFLIHFPIDFTKLVNFNTRISLSVFQLMKRIVLSIFCSALSAGSTRKMACALLYNPALILQPQPAQQVKKCSAVLRNVLNRRAPVLPTSSLSLLFVNPQECAAHGRHNNSLDSLLQFPVEFLHTGRPPLIQSCPSMSGDFGLFVTLWKKKREWWGKKGG